MKAMWQDKLVRLYLVLFILNAFSLSMMAAFAAIKDLKALTAGEWIVITCSVIGNCTGTLLAFMNKNASKLESGQLPVEIENGK